jgi:MerR family transcriptional regulator, light-induced transcriptional regulator
VNAIEGYSDVGEPIYTIGVVARLTDIAMETLRAWERRYGFPQPTRTEGGHRLYSEADLRRLRWVKAQIDQGTQASRAIRSLRQRTHSPGTVEAASSYAGEESRHPTVLTDVGSRLADRLLRHEPEGADQLLGDLMAAHSIEDLLLEVIPGALARIGEGWQDGRTSIATEHLASHYLRQRLHLWIVAAPPARDARPVILTGAPGEQHEGSLLILNALLRRQGWPVAYLGSSTPLEDVATMARETRACVVAFVAMTEGPARALMQWPRFFPGAADGGPPVIGFGGRIFTENPGWRAQIPGLFLGASLRDGFQRLDSLLSSFV